jgi:hypothetical protein
VSDPNGDDDNDGHKNWEELVTRTGPRDGQSVMKFDVIHRQGGQVELRWRAVPGLQYHIRRTRQLGNPSAWQEIGMVTPTSSVGSFFDVFVGDTFFDVFVDIQ